MRALGPILAVVLAVAGCGAYVAALPLISPPSPPVTPPPGSPCSGPIIGGPAPGVLLATGTTFLASEGFPFCLSQSATLNGSWSAPDPTAAAVLVPDTITMWPCPGCYARNGSFEESLFPGSYVVEFLSGSSGSQPPDVVYVDEALELVFDRATIVLQPAGERVVGPQASLNWSFALPAGASAAGLSSSEQIQRGYEAGVMSPAQWTKFQSNESAFNWESLAWFALASGGGDGPILTTGPLNLAPGNYYFVFYNDQTSSNAVDFTTPLYFAFTAG